MKRLFLIFLLSSGSLGLLITACDFCKDIKPYWLPEKVDLNLLQANRDTIMENSVFERDTLLLSIHYNPTFLTATHSSWQNYFTNPVYALKCSPEGYMGIKQEVVSFELISNIPFEGIEAGESLNAKLFDLQGNNFDIEKLNEDLSNENWPILNTYFRLIRQEPQEELRNFKLTIQLSSGQVLESTSSSIIW